MGLQVSETWCSFEAVSSVAPHPRQGLRALFRPGACIWRQERQSQERMARLIDRTLWTKNPAPPGVNSPGILASEAHEPAFAIPLSGSTRSRLPSPCPSPGLGAHLAVTMKGIK